MASSNVEYYQKQKDLQDSIIENEQKRKRLEAQLQAYSQSDHKLAKLRAVKLQSYWKRICEDEKRSKQRNAQLLRDLDRMEANMASLEARREKLRHMKQQYFDYIERAYPKWLELVQQKKQEYIQEQQQKHEQHFQQQHQQQFQQQQYEQQQRQQQQQQQYEQQQRQQQQQQQYEQQQSLHQQQQQQQFSSSQRYDHGRQHYGQSPVSQPYRNEEQTVPKQQEAFLTQQHYEDVDGPYQDGRDEESPPPLPSQPPPRVAFSGPEREYTNLKDIRRETQAPAASQPQSVTVHMPSAQRDAVSPSKSGRPGSGRRSEQPNWTAAERDASIQSVSYSEDTDLQPPPIQSVTVRQKTEPPKPVVQMMGPVSDEDVSDFGDEPDLPSGAGVLPEKVEEVKAPSPVQAADDVLQEEDDEEDTDQTPSVVHPDISTAGLYRLLKFVEEELLNALALEGFYRTRNPDEATKKDIIYKANNSNSSLQTLDAELVSMVILQQLTLVVRRLPGACMLSDTLLVRGGNSLSEDEIRANLHRDAQVLWDKLLEHFILLVKNRVMGTREVAHVFVPCLVHSGSDNQAKAVSVIEGVIENAMDKADGKTSPLPQDSITVDTARSSQQGAVPPLKFGSLVDSKPFSDEESSMIITQSMNTDVQKVPLNETDAYKNLISGTRPAVRSLSHDDTDDTDNELEKQIASTLSPRSHGSKPHSDPHNEVPFSAPKDESHDLSLDQEEPQSDLSSPSAPPVYVPTGAEQSTVKSILGSTGGSSQQRKIVGMISSDLDSDIEVDLDHMVQKKEEDDDDFYDFYG